MLASLSPTPRGSRGQMELHVGFLCRRGGWNKRKQITGFFSERPKEESENISVSQYMRCLCGTHRISMHAAALEWVGVCFLSEALGGGLTSNTIPDELWGKPCKISQTEHQTGSAQGNLEYVFIHSLRNDAEEQWEIATKSLRCDSWQVKVWDMVHSSSPRCHAVQEGGDGWSGTEW